MGCLAAAVLAAAEHPVVLKGGVLPFFVAGAVGVGIGAVEQASRLRSRFTLKNQAGWWWAARLFLEGGISALAMLVLREAKPNIANHVWAWVIAGGAGPAVMRLRVLDLEKRPVGVATIFEPVRDFLEEQIDRRSAECVATWISYDVLPRLGRLGTEPAELVSYASDWVNARYRMDARKARGEIEWLEHTRDGGQSTEVKRELIVRRIALELGGYRLIERYLSEREAGPTRNAPG